MYHESLKLFYVVGLEASQSTVQIYTALQLEGPWTEHSVYAIPPLSEGDFAHAAKGHPELAAHDEIVFTYNINGNTKSDTSIYHPRFVRVKVDSSAASALAASAPVVV